MTNRYSIYPPPPPPDSIGNDEWVMDNRNSHYALYYPIIRISNYKHQNRATSISLLLQPIINFGLSPP